jgi:predicted deacylase
VRIGTAESQPSTIAKGTLSLGEYPDGSPITSPVILAQGAKSGPVLWVQGCVHGPEVAGPLGIQAFLSALRLEDLCGTVICLMTANPLAFRDYRRFTPQDGANLNRVYPGHAEGSLSEAMAHRSFSAAIAVADAMIDLHSGGDHLICCHHVFYHDDGSPAGSRSAELAKRVGAPILCNVPMDGFVGAAFSSFAARGKPAVLVESGGGARVTRSDIDNHARAIRGAAAFLDMLPTADETVPAHRGGSFSIIRSRRGGIFHPTATVGQMLGPDEEIGRVVTFFGDVVEICRNPMRSAWLAALRRPYMPVYSGDELAELAEAV